MTSVAGISSSVSQRKPSTASASIRLGDSGQGGPGDLLALVARPRDHQQQPARRDQRGERLRRLVQQRVGQGLQRVAFMDEVESAAPVGRRREQVRGAIVDGALRKTPLRPGDGRLDQIESGDARAGGGERLGIVAEPAADIERAQAVERPAPGEPGGEQRMRREIGPGHAGGVALGEAIHRLEPVLALRILLDAARPLVRIDRVEPRPGRRAARVEFLGHACFSHLPSSFWRQ